VREVDIRISVCGVLMWAGVVRAAGIAGRHLQTYAVADGMKYGLVVTSCGRYMAVSYCDENKLRVYRLEADGTATLLHTVGSEGSGPMEFRSPANLCLTPAGNLLVCDCGNDRVQELTVLGEAEPRYVRLIRVANLVYFALHGDMVAVAIGDGTGMIKLLNYSTGKLVHNIICESTRPGGQKKGYSTSFRFSPDGQHIVTAEYGNPRLSMFRVSNGRLAKLVGGTGTDVVSRFEKDVEFGPNGDLLVADCGRAHVCVFSAESDALVHSWGAQGETDGQFTFPTALALVDAKLFVLDGGSPRVQVFE
jgi:6-phosphogluconolactonase (cycloisomerase 2 family)